MELETPKPRDGVRVDRWLWAVRIFKTRVLAAQACRMSQVTLAGQAVKPSRMVRVGDVLEVEHGSVKRTLKVEGLLERRVGAKVVSAYLEDLTPESVWEKAWETREQARGNRVYQGEEGGRPSKRDRRRMEAFEEQAPPTED